MLVWRNGKLLLIERKRGTLGFAPPAGHVEEGDPFEETAKRELEEEVGLNAKTIELVIEGRKENPCRRAGGSWHYWKIYKVEATGEVTRSEDETKSADFYSVDQLRLLAERADEYLRGEIAQDAWEQSPGLEPVWREWLKEMAII
jgi:ADP-ribose pyrophosphatase YjhB (NUDIX family)